MAGAGVCASRRVVLVSKTQAAAMMAHSAPHRHETRCVIVTFHLCVILTLRPEMRKRQFDYLPPAAAAAAAAAAVAAARAAVRRKAVASSVTTAAIAVGAGPEVASARAAAAASAIGIRALAL